MTKNLLIVDDEKPVLDSLKRTFFSLDFICFFALSADEAMNILANEQIDLIITDMKMPNKSGYELLLEVKKKYPKIIKFILSGYADKEIIIKSIFNGIANIFFIKPWDNEAILKQVNYYLDLKDFLTANNIMEIINSNLRFPVLPGIYNGLLSLIDGNKSNNGIINIIKNDLSYTAKILGFANAVYNTNKTGSIKNAINYLGIENIKNITLANNLFDFTESNIKDWDFYNIEIISKQAYISNKIADFLYLSIFSKSIPEDFTSCCLLNNIGMYLIRHNFKDKIENIIKKARSSANKSLIDAEKEVIGISHNEIGACLFKWWNMPDFFADSCLYSHNPLSEKNRHKNLLCIFHLADYFSWKHLGNYPFNQSIKNEIYEYLKTNEAFVENEIRKINFEF